MLAALYSRNMKFHITLAILIFVIGGIALADPTATPTVTVTTTPTVTPTQIPNFPTRIPSTVPVAHVYKRGDTIYAVDRWTGTETKVANRSGSLTIDSGETLTFVDTVWDDLRIPGEALGRAASAPELATFGPSGSLQAYTFDGDDAGGLTLEQVYFSIQLPHNYKQGTAIYPHVHWTPTTAGTGNVEWFLEYSWSNRTDAFTAPLTISGVGAASGAAWTHTMTNIGTMPIDGTGKTISSMLECRLYRDPADEHDTYAADAAILEFDVHYEIDSCGSSSETAK